MTYTYAGVKFTTTWLGKNEPHDQRLDELKYWCNVFHEKNLAPPYEGGSYGNLSFRITPGLDHFIITAAKSSLCDSNTNDRFVTVRHVDLEHNIVHALGKREPSSETMVHHAVYHARPDVHAVFHGHCAAITRDATRLGIPITSTEEPYGTPALVYRVLETLGHVHFLEMRNHGFLALGASLTDAGKHALTSLLKCTKDTAGMLRHENQHEP